MQLPDVHRGRVGEQHALVSQRDEPGIRLGGRQSGHLEVLLRQVVVVDRSVELVAEPIEPLFRGSEIRTGRVVGGLRAHIGPGDGQLLAPPRARPAR